MPNGTTTTCTSPGTWASLAVDTLARADSRDRKKSTTRLTTHSFVEMRFTPLRFIRSEWSYVTRVASHAAKSALSDAPEFNLNAWDVGHSLCSPGTTKKATFMATLADFLLPPHWFSIKNRAAYATLTGSNHPPLLGTAHNTRWMRPYAR